MAAVTSTRVFSPAKINLFLAITGKRPDGYHDLVSLVAPLAFGDEMRVETADAGFTLECDDARVPLDASNLILRAAQAFGSASGLKAGARFFLQKRIPMGAGLGGGSSNAVAALRALNALYDGCLNEGRLVEIAASLGSDCPLFLKNGPVVMRGRGEQVETLSEASASRLRGRRILVFKPDFGIATAGAYASLAKKGASAYLPQAEADRKLAAWIADPASSAEDILYNTLEIPAFEKFVALPTLLDLLKGRFGLAPRMSGSGSACFALLPPDGASLAGTASSLIRDAWGPATFCVETRIA